MKIYFKVVFTVLLFVVFFGFGFPFAISSDNTENVILGIVGVCLSPLVAYYTVKSILNDIKDKLKKEEKDEI